MCAAAVVGLLALGSAACSSGGGFGSPMPPAYPQGGNYPNPTFTGSPGPLGANPLSSVSPGPTESPTTPYLSSTVLRAAYDASATDPVKAARLLELTFAFKNPTEDPDSVSTITVAADDDPAGKRMGMSLPIPANKASDVGVAAISIKQDLAKVKHISFSFANPDGDEIVATTLPPPALSLTFTPLDEKQAAGSLTIVGTDFSRVTGPGSGLHYECTIGLVNASGTKVGIDNFTVTPPKGAPVTIAVPVSIPSRTSASLITFIIPYSGKSLPGGNYTITANSANNALAQASTGLI